jgi:hypothetical protein
VHGIHSEGAGRVLKVALGAAGLLAAPAAAFPQQALEAVPLSWAGKDISFADLPAPLADAAFDAVDIWKDWAASHDYRMYLSSGGRALLLLSRGQKHAERRCEELENVCEFFAEHFLPAGARPDPDVPPAERRPDFAQTVALLEFHTEQDYDTALERLLEEYPFYGTFDKLKEDTGFVLPRSWVGGWLERAPDVEQWKPEHELINRGTLLFLSERYGLPPLWLRLGSAWYAEFEMKKRIHSFPYRDEFVFTVEHEGYEKKLAAEFQKRKNEPLRLEELIQCQPDQFSSDCAALSWGMVTFLGRYTQALPAMLQEFEKLGAQHPGEEDAVPPEQQLAVLDRCAGGEVLEQVSDFFRQGKRYRPPAGTSGK